MPPLESWCGDQNSGWHTNSTRCTPSPVLRALLILTNLNLEKNLKENGYVCVQLIPFVEQQKLTQHRKSTIHQYSFFFLK